MKYYRLRPKDNPEENGIVVSSEGKLEILAGNMSLELISEKDALKLKEDAENWSLQQLYVASDSSGKSSILG
jgi:hypothetical protein